METFELTHIELADPSVAEDEFLRLFEVEADWPVQDSLLRKVQSEASEKFYALKKLNLSVGLQSASQAQRTMEKRRKALHAEFKTLAQLADLELLARPYAYATHRGSDVLLLEWIEGVPLENLDELGHLPEIGSADRALLCAQLSAHLLKALVQLEQHQEAFIHRNLTPYNILICTQKSALDEQMGSGQFDIRFVGLGGHDPDPHYAAPELLAGWRLGEELPRPSAKSDVYAVCSLVWELLCGKLPYELAARASFEDNYAAKTRRPRVATGLAADSTGVVLAQLLEKGLAASPKDRLSADELLADMRRYLELFPKVEELYEEDSTEKGFSTFQTFISFILVFLIIALAGFAWLIASLMPPIASLFG